MARVRDVQHGVSSVADQDQSRLDVGIRILHTQREGCPLAAGDDAAQLSVEGQFQLLAKRRVILGQQLPRLLWSGGPYDGTAAIMQGQKR